MTTLTSNALNSVIPYQLKIDAKINKLIDTISPEFKHCNPILSGSYLIHLVVSPETEYSDYDFYFSSQEDFNKAYDVLSKTYTLKFKNKNCVTFASDFDNKEIQIINTYFGSPSEIIAQHDLHNSKIAYSNETLYYTKEFLIAWSSGEIDIDTFQIKDVYSDALKFSSYASTVGRIKKYAQRYSLSLSSKTILSLSSLLKQLKETDDFKDEILIFQDSAYISIKDVKITNKQSLILVTSSLINQNSFLDENSFDESLIPEPIEF